MIIQSVPTHRQIGLMALVVVLLLPLQASVTAPVAEKWVAIYNGPADGFDSAFGGIVTGASGNVCVAGKSDGVGTGGDFATVCYDGSGNTLWTARYNGKLNGEDASYGIAMGPGGNIYVTGWSKGVGSEWDIATVAYDSSGHLLWESRYDGPYGGDDQVYDITVDADANVYVSGLSEVGFFQRDCIVIAYDDTGAERWVATYNGPGDGFDNGTGVATDSLGNVYVASISDGGNLQSTDIAVVKYDANGGQLWSARYDGTDGDQDSAFGIAVADSGTVYVTGSSKGIGSEDDYATVAFDTAGNQLWVARYDGGGGGFDSARDIAVGPSGNIYVTGIANGGASGPDIVTIAYNPAGDELWTATYNGPANQGDRGESIAVGPSDEVYVGGFSAGAGSLFEATTVAYDADGLELWVQRFEDPLHESSMATGIAVDGSGNVTIAGSVIDTGSESDFLTVQYGVPDDEDEDEDEDGDLEHESLETGPEGPGQIDLMAGDDPFRKDNRTTGSRRDASPRRRSDARTDSD